MEVDEMARKDVLSKLVENKNPEYPEDYGFHYSSNVPMIRRCVDVLQQFNQWPDQGGMLDQDAFLVDDMLTYKQIYNVKFAEHESMNNDG